MKDGTRDQLIDHVARGREAEVAESFLADRLAERRRSVSAKIFAKIQAGAGLDPQEAVQAWLTLYEIEALEGEIRAKKRVAVKAGEKLKAEIDPPPARPLHYRNT